MLLILMYLHLSVSFAQANSDLESAADEILSGDETTPGNPQKDPEDDLALPFSLSFTFGTHYRYLRFTETEILYRNDDNIRVLPVKECNQRLVEWFRLAMKYSMENSLFYRQEQKDEEEVQLTLNGEQIRCRYNTKAGNYLRRLEEHLDRLHNDSKVACFVPTAMEMWSKPYSRIPTWVQREEQIRFGVPYHWYQYRYDSRENYIPLWYDEDNNGGDYPIRTNR